MTPTAPRPARRIALHLFLIAFIGLTLLPVALVVRKAVTPGQEFELTINPIPRQVTLDHFRAVLGRKATDGTWLFGRQLLNSAVVATATTILGLFFACTAAYAFSRFRFPGRALGLLVFLVVQMFPATLLLIPMYVILAQLGLLNSMLGLVMIYSTTALPFCVWMLKGYFDTIPKELEEAALIDGAGRIAVFYRVVLPLARPALAVTALFSFMTAWNEYIMAATFLNREETYTLPVLIKGFVGEHGSVEWGSFAAGAVIVSAPVVALFYALQRYLVAGLTAGGVKG
ncbi:MAG: carbohydrate ABC transporter permease [Deltaproteobacteria bacterium]|nr:carbohydrate ABC transporter permease [Deltaproteobacteria bacterium]